ncbi:cupin domain-containing protein [Aurantimonas sp. 22II-16-19i]|uniref:cupin domain-containing protein n=1 Tax=Aurantimonas sp. 22II-16-19i TaxID=1317114 RepID=UPI0009F7E7F3|nr:cupin domain-containing protein [Aurantimonas sp. 22II-16-19i]ORE86531.1 hypothetical protein ATO4_25930 [Aurantimonas sp. 22II-16-19i]
MPATIADDPVLRIAPGTAPDYDSANPLMKLMRLSELQHLAAERHFYLTDDLQALLPFSHLTLVGPQGEAADVLDPKAQDSKTDFQKQNVRDFVITDTYLLRGWVTVQAWQELGAYEPYPDRIVPFIKLSYQGGPDSKLAVAMGRLPGDSIRLYVKVNGREAGELVRVPLNETTDRYEIEFWGDHRRDLRAMFSADGDVRALAALDRGELVTRPDLIAGERQDFAREGKDDVDVTTVSPYCAMHPVRTLKVEVAWADQSGTVWDSNDGRNYRYEFNMPLRGWDAYLKAGVSANPHGGVGILHYRNLMSNYFGFAGSRELGRVVEPWQFDAYGNKAQGERYENFFSLDYVDLHILKNDCGIGLHRHRDNQEIFFMLKGQAMMITGDWYQQPERERCFELRTLKEGHYALLKPGMLHGLMNATDNDIHLLMFGGYD